MTEAAVADDLSLDDLAAIYIKIRDTKEAKEAAFKEELRGIEEQLQVVSDRILEICREQDADSVRTKSGTITRRVTTRYWTSDWESMYQFIKEHDAPFLLHQRIHSGNMKQFLQENPDVMPMGLQTDAQYTLVVRRSRNNTKELADE
jgi:hypothetical protein